MAALHPSFRTNIGYRTSTQDSTLPLFTFLIGVPLTLMNLNFTPANNGSPFETHGLLMPIFVITILVYTLSFYTSNYPAIIWRIRILSGGLAFVLLVMILLPDLGMLFLLGLVIYSVKLIYDACKKLYQHYNRTSSDHHDEEIIRDSTSSNNSSTTVNDRHAVLVFPIVVLLGLLPLKFQSIAAPFNTHNVVMSILLVTIVVNAVAWAIEVKLPDDENFSYLQVIISKISLLSGSLATVLLVLVIFPTIGWFPLFVWTVFFVKLIYEACRKLHQMYQDMSVIRSSYDALHRVLGRDGHNNIRRNSMPA